VPGEYAITKKLLTKKMIQILHKKMIQKTTYYSWKANNFAEGCKQCIIGRKLVVFVTGICPKNCFYCPISEEKKNKDVIFANERPLIDEFDTKSLIEEAIISKSFGASFTGGDPLAKNERTCKFIKILKKRFGKRFHTHLYTIPESLDNSRLLELEKAGLDELRLHPEIFDDKNWNKINLLYADIKKLKRKYSFNLGIEIPAIPGYETETKKLLDYFSRFVDFININELEISDTNACKLVENKFVTKDSASYAVKGSKELGLRLMQYLNKKSPKKNIHFCTCKLKDKVQLRERLKIRAQSVKNVFDIIDDDGMIIRGCIYLKGYEPNFSYIKKLKRMSESEKEIIISKLEKIRMDLCKKFSIPKKMLSVDRLKPRIITNIGIIHKLNKYLKSKKLIAAIVHQYPSYDQMEVDVEFI
jgi:uncharacterized protein